MLPSQIILLFIFFHSTLTYINKDCFVTRMEINITNTVNETFSEGELHIEIDTASAISEGLMQGDCSDIRFYHLGEAKWLEYWIDSQCNNEKTGVWLKMDAVAPISHNSIEVYSGYFCGQALSEFQLQWSSPEDGFVFPFLDNCANSMVGSHQVYQELGVSDRLVKIGSSFEIIDGNLKHEHLLSGVSGHGTMAIDTRLSTEGGIGGKVVKFDHRHYYEKVTEEIPSVEDVLPPFVRVSLCRSQRVQILEDSVTFFSKNAIPSDYTAFWEANGNELFFYASQTDLGDTGGSASHSHTHVAVMSDNPIFEDTTVYTFIRHKIPVQRSACYWIHGHAAYSGTTDSASNIPPFYTLVSATPKPGRAVYAVGGQDQVFLATEQPPLGFVDASFIPNEVFLRSSSTWASEGGMDPRNNHTHDFSVSFGFSTLQIDGDRDSSSNAAKIQHVHPDDVDRESQGVAYEIPAVQLRAVLRKDIENIQATLEISYGEVQLLADVKCFSVEKTDPSVCSARGNCTGANLCVCNPGYTGNMCEKPICHGLVSDDPSVCTAHGRCVNTDDCSCTTAHYSGAECENWSCFDVSRQDTDVVCSGGRGACTAHNTCECFEPDVYSGVKCENFYCYGVVNTDKKDVCSGFGECSSPQNCTCLEKYWGSTCEEFECYGIHWSITGVCSNHGVCVGNDACECSGGYYGMWCSQWDCKNIHKDSEYICHGHGECLSPDMCECSNFWTGKFCNVPICFKKNASDPSVCSGHGICEREDVCVCDSKLEWHGPSCGLNDNICGKRNASDPLVCKGRGNCIKNKCQCIPGWKGSFCETIKITGQGNSQTGAVVTIVVLFISSAVCGVFVIILIVCIGYFWQRGQHFMKVREILSKTKLEILQAKEKELKDKELVEVERLKEEEVKKREGIALKHSDIFKLEFRDNRQFYAGRPPQSPRDRSGAEQDVESEKRDVGPDEVEL